MRKALTQEKNNGFPFLDIYGYLKNTHKNPKFGRVRRVPIWELGWEFPGWDLSHFAKFGILWVYFFKYPKISKNGNPLFFPVNHKIASCGLLLSLLREIYCCHFECLNEVVLFATG